MTLPGYLEKGNLTILKIGQMGFQQFLTTRPWGAVYPRLEGFCIIIAVGLGRFWDAMLPPNGADMVSGERG